MLSLALVKKLELDLKESLGLGEFEAVLETRDKVEGLHNCREFSLPLECLLKSSYGNTGKKFSVAFIT